MAGIGGYDGWRWIFIVSWFSIIGWPETSKFLTVEERQILLRRLSDDAAEAKMDRAKPSDVLLATGRSTLGVRSLPEHLTSSN